MTQNQSRPNPEFEAAAKLPHADLIQTTSGQMAWVSNLPVPEPENPTVWVENGVVMKLSSPPLRFTA